MMSGTTGYLLDTNVVLALIRANSLGQCIDQQYGLRAALNRSMICIVTVGEMLSLVRQFNWGQAKREELQSLLNEIVWLDINHPDILDAYGEIDHASLQQGRKLGKNDAWIAATAKVTGATLLTTDPDFDHLQGTYLDRIWINPVTPQSTS
jgi:predicted nucleic acid-binding protein